MSTSTSSRKRLRTIPELTSSYLNDSAQFGSLSPSSQEKYRAVCNYLNLMFPTTDPRKVERADMIDLRDRLKGTPGKANLVIGVSSALFSYAADIGAVAHNPCLGIRRLKTQEHHPWADESIEAFKTYSKGIARRGFYLGLYTGQRAVDILNMKRCDVDDQYRLHVKQAKTGTRLVIPLHEELLREMANWSVWTATPNHVLIGSDLSYWTFHRSFMAECARLNVEESFHGLRKTMAKRLAEGGATEAEIMAITGHRTSQMVSFYTKEADQARRAASAIKKL